MSPVTLDPAPALVLIDLQEGIVALPTAHPADELVARAAALAAAFREHGLATVLVNVAGQAPGRTEADRPGGELPPGWTDLVAEIDPQPGDHRVTKLRWGAFHGTGLHAHLRDLGVTQIVLAGIATSMGVESTARSAHEHGYHVTLVTDAMTDTSAAAHDHSVTHVFPMLGQRATTEEILQQLSSRGPAGSLR
jgi:nicotinamidase-related amidase